MARTLRVLLGDVDAAVLHAVEGTVTLRLNPGYLKLAQRPVLGQWFEDRLSPDPMVSQGLPSWFENLLPEGALRGLLSRRHGRQGADSFELVSVLGADDLPGNVRVVGDAAGSTAEGFNYSLPGDQLRFSVVKVEGGWTAAPKGTPGDWIITPPDSRSPGWAENAHAMTQWARLSGLRVVETALTPSAQGMTLAEKRIDRGPDGKRIHTEDVAQVFGLHPNEKFTRMNQDSILRLAVCLTSEAEALEVLNRMVFNAVIANADAHAKHWSLVYEQPQRATMAPAANLVSSLDDLGMTQSALAFGGRKDWAALDAASVEKVARRAGLKETRAAQSVRVFLDAVVAAWTQHSAQWTLSPGLRGKLEEHWRTVPLLRAHRDGL